MIGLQSVSFGDLPTPEEKSGNGKYKPIPDGEYTFQIVETDYDVTQSGFERINVKCEIVGGDYAGKTVYHKFFIGHPDPARKQAVEIGLADLKALCTHNGKTGWPTSHTDLQAWRFNAKLTYRQYNGTWYKDLKYLSKAGPTKGQYGVSQGYIALLAEYNNQPSPSTSFNDDDIPF